MKVSISTRFSNKLAILFYKDYDFLYFDNSIVFYCDTKTIIIILPMVYVMENYIFCQVASTIRGINA